MAKEKKTEAERARLTSFERFALNVSPKWATQRYYQRVQLEHAAREYESVQLSRLHKKKQDSRSPDQIGATSADKLRFQARNIDENHDVGKSVLNTLVANVVGGGITTFPMVKNPDGTLNNDVNKQIMAWFRRWGLAPEVTWEESWSRSQQLACRTFFRDGEEFTQKFLGNVEGVEHSTEVPFSISLMEPDFCPTNVFSDGSTPRVSTQVAAGNRVRQGVEKNSVGRPEAYWLYKAYPTELQTQFSPFLLQPINVSLSLDGTNLERVEARFIQHLKMTDRIRQTRGISIFASVYNRLDDLKEFEESERIAARIGAAFAFAITKSIDSLGESGDMRWREMDIAPGIIADGLAPGDNLESLKNERPMNGVAEWRTTQLRSVAGGTNAGFSSLAKTYEGSYSSQRQELMEQFVIYRMLRDHFVSKYVAPIYRDFVLMLTTAGLVDVRGIDERTLFDAEHVGRGAPYIEPLKEVSADERKVQSGFNARHQIILERGGNPLETTALIQAEREADEEAGLVFSSTVQPEPANPEPLVSETDDDEDDNDDDEDEDDNENILEGSFVQPRGGWTIGRKYEDEDGNVYRYTTQGFILENELANVV